MYARFSGSIIKDIPDSFDLTTSVPIGRSTLGIHTLDASPISKKQYALNAEQLSTIQERVEKYDFNLVFIHEPFHKMQTDYKRLKGSYLLPSDHHDAEAFLDAIRGTQTDVSLILKRK